MEYGQIDGCSGGKMPRRASTAIPLRQPQKQPEPIVFPTKSIDSERIGQNLCVFFAQHLSEKGIGGL